MKIKYYFLGSARCFHTIDWYNSARKVLNYEIEFITDLIDGEGFNCLVKDKKEIKKLFILDKFLPKSYDVRAHRLRNLLKFIFIPIQAILLYLIISKNKNHLIYAHSTYYAFIASLVGANYVSTPQGSEVLVRLENSFLYRVFAFFAHKNALLVTVDSFNMQHKLKKILGIQSSVIQNGVDIQNIKKLSSNQNQSRTISLLSIRGISKNYEIDKILKCKDKYLPEVHLDMCAPFIDKTYYQSLNLKEFKNINFLGKLTKDEFQKTLLTSKVVVSIPKSDSSPRSVYESIFSGCIVIVKHNNFLKFLPEDMLNRVVIANTDEDDWLRSAYEQALGKLNNNFFISEQSMNLFDQNLSVQRVNDELHRK